MLWMVFTPESIFNLFLIVSAIHGLLFSVVIFFSRNGREKSMLFLNLLVLSISLNNLQSWILTKHFFKELFFLDYVHIPWHFLIAPFFYMFLLHYLKIADRCKNILKVIIPIFISIILIRISFIYAYRNINTSDVVYIFERYTSIEEIVSLLFSLSIFGYSFYILYKKEKLFPQILAFDNLQWIYTFFKIGAIAYLFWIIALAITVYLNFSEFIYSYYPLRVLTTILIYWIGYQGIMSLKVIKERVVIRKNLLGEKHTKNILVNSFDENNTDKQEQFQQINQYIIEHKRYTDSTITLEILAKERQISSSLFSVLINTYAKKSFSDYINEFRVDQAKKLLMDTTYNKYTIISVGLESGFNSKSTFFSVFKKQTGHTPSAYKKAQLI